MFVCFSFKGDPWVGDFQVEITVVGKGLAQMFSNETIRSGLFLKSISPNSCGTAGKQS